MYVAATMIVRLELSYLFILCNQMPQIRGLSIICLEEPKKKKKKNTKISQCGVIVSYIGFIIFIIRVFSIIVIVIM
jgi:hypothetical protein